MTSGSAVATTLQLPVARMVGLAQALETTADTVFSQDGIRLPEDSGRMRARILPQLADDLLSRAPAPPPPRVVAEIRLLIDELLCGRIGRAIVQASSRRVFAAFHRVRPAEEMMRASSDEPLSVLDMARVLGVSLRSLQPAFAEVHNGLTPRDVLTRIRLEKARGRLLAADADSRATTIAHD